MRVSERFAVVILIVAVGMSAMSLGTTDPVAAQGSKRYIILGANEQLPSGFEAIVAAAGGRVVETVPEIGLAVVESDEPSFMAAAGGISGIEAVAEDEEVFIGGPTSDIVVESEAEAEGIVAEGHSPQLARFFLVQWALKTVQADRAWAEGFKGSPSVEVAVIDTGIDYTHQELVGKVDLNKSASFYHIDETSGATRLPLPPMLPPTTVIKPFLDFNGHGTNVASAIAGHGMSVAGVAPHVRLIAVKVGGRNGFAPWSAILLGIKHATDVGADVINMSFASRMTKDELKADHLKQALKRAMKYAARHGVFLVASAGNEATNWDHESQLIKVPAEFEEVNAVSATAPSNQINFDAFAPYSDFGRTIVDFAAPGGNATPFRCLPVFAPRGGPMIACTPVSPSHPMYSMGMPADAVIMACSRFVEFLPMNPRRFPCSQTTPPFVSGRTNVFNLGTSFSAAMVSGVAALVDSVAGGALTGDQIRHILRQSAADLGQRGPDDHFGYGRVDALAAVRCAQQHVSMNNGEAKVKGNCN